MLRREQGGWNHTSAPVMRRPLLNSHKVCSTALVSRVLWRDHRQRILFTDWKNCGRNAENNWIQQKLQKQLLKEANSAKTGNINIDARSMALPKIWYGTYCHALGGINPVQLLMVPNSAAIDAPLSRQSLFRWARGPSWFIIALLVAARRNWSNSL